MRHDGCCSGSKCEILKYKSGDILIRVPFWPDRVQLGIYLGDRELDPRIPVGFGQGQEPHTIVWLLYDGDRLFFDGHYCGNIEPAGWNPTNKNRIDIVESFIPAYEKNRDFAQRWLVNELRNLYTDLYSGAFKMIFQS